MDQRTVNQEELDLLTKLRDEHKQLDQRIQSLERQPSVSVPEQTELKRLKIRKLTKKTQISTMESQSLGA